VGDALCTTVRLKRHQPFYTYDDVPLFAVNANVPVEDALEVAANLMLYVESLAAADAFMDKAMESAVIQHLSETARALMQSCGHTNGAEGKAAA